MSGPPLELIAFSALVLCTLLIIAVWRLIEATHTALQRDHRRRTLADRLRKAVGR